MSGAFRPRLDVLPRAQRDLWPDLRPLKNLGFVLYGGTAVALRLGHRASVDFDFFSDRPLARDRLIAAVPLLARATVLQDSPDAWTVLTPTNVKASFFGPVRTGRIGDPETTEDGAASVASLDDLLATKLKVLLQRVEAKDYRDVAAMLRAGAVLARGLGAAKALFGPGFQPSESLKALTYFEGGDLGELASSEKASLLDEARAVRDIPVVPILSPRLTD